MWNETEQMNMMSSDTSPLNISASLFFTVSTLLILELNSNQSDLFFPIYLVIKNNMIIYNHINVSVCFSVVLHTSKIQN
jgi:hypothetical protein